MRLGRCRWRGRLVVSNLNQLGGGTFGACMSNTLFLTQCRGLVGRWDQLWVSGVGLFVRWRGGRHSWVVYRRNGGIGGGGCGGRYVCGLLRGVGRPIRVRGMCRSRCRGRGLCGGGGSWVFVWRGGGRGMGVGCGRVMLGAWM